MISHPPFSPSLRRRGIAIATGVEKFTSPSPSPSPSLPYCTRLFFPPFTLPLVAGPPPPCFPPPSPLPNHEYQNTTCICLYAYGGGHRTRGPSYGTDGMGCGLELDAGARRGGGFAIPRPYVPVPGIYPVSLPCLCLYCVLCVVTNQERGYEHGVGPPIPRTVAAVSNHRDPTSDGDGDGDP